MAASAWHFGMLATPCFMGVLNVTPDSFSDGGKYVDAAEAAERARGLALEGAQVIDLGAEATSFFRAGVEPVAAEAQLGRLMPVLERLGDLEAVISIDTRSAAVARAALARGGGGKGVVRIINDVSAGRDDPEMLPLIARMGAAVVLMHRSPGFPATPAADDADIVATVRAELAERFAAAVSAGIAPEKIALDPGIGFGKTMADNWRLAAAGRAILPEGVRERGVVVLGASRKRFLETEPPANVQLPAWWGPLVKKLEGMGAHARDGKSAAVAVLNCRCAGNVHRVHNVELAERALALTVLD